MSLVLAGVIAAGTVGMVSAEDVSPEMAKGVKFKDDPAYSVNTYTGYVGGVRFNTSVSHLLGALENSNGIEVQRDGVVVESGDVMHGDKLVLKADDGSVKAEYSIIIVGNADKNAKFNLGDAAVMLKKIAKWDVDIDEVAADVNGDGVLNLGDVSLFLKMTARWGVEFVNAPVVPGKGDGRVSSVVATFGNGDRANVNLRKGQDYAVKFSVEEGKLAKYVKANYPSWGDAKGSLRLSLYKWDTDYETTVANDPIVTEKYENFADNAEIIFSFTDTAGKGIGEGEYLWRIHEGFDERVNPDNESEPVGVGMWTYDTPAEDSGMTVFFEGEALEPGTKAYGPEAYIGIGD